MVKNIGRNINTTDVAVVSAAVQMTDGAVAEIVSSANVDRTYLAITVTGFNAFVRLQDAATDSGVRKGILVPRDGTYEMPVDNIYTGEISIINEMGAVTPTYYVTEY